MPFGSSQPERDHLTSIAREREIFSPIRWRLTALNLAVLLIILVILESGIYVILSRNIYERVDSTLVSRAEQVIRSGQLRDPLRTMTFPSRIAAATAEGLFYLVLDEQGIVVVNPQAVPLEDLTEIRSPMEAALSGGPDLRTVSLGDGQTVRLYTIAVRNEPGRVTGILQVGRPLASEQHALGLIKMLFGAAALLAVVLGTVGGLFMADRALVPIRRAFERQQDFVADASHELRTPLTLIRANTEMVTRHPDQPVADSLDLLNDVLRETDRLGGLVADLLTLARADAGQEQLNIATVALDELVQHAARQFAPLAAQSRITFDVDASRPTMVLGDAARLQQLLVILIDNSLKHTPEGGRVSIRCQTSKAMGRLPVTLTVADTGPGIAAEHLPHLFERFYRVDPARAHGGGAGLGLAIAQWIVSAHGGKITVTSKVGAGTTFAVQLPAP